MNNTISRSNVLYFTVATAGHVDHGKTSLLRALTGIDPDRLKEEKMRGLTTDLGFAHLTVRDQNAGGVAKIGFVDVPGHGKFLKNMLAGVGGIDLALLVVAADEGPMPQTIQHVKILSLLGVKNVLLLVTKIDIASQEQRQSAIEQSQELLEQHQLSCIASLPVSATTGAGLDKVVPLLLESLKAKVDRTERSEDPAYLPIDRVFTKAGYGTVITGTLVRGVLTTGDNVFIEPGNVTARVRGMESFGKQVENAHAGQRLAVNLVLKQSKALLRGQAIFLAPPTECQNLIARFNLFETDSAADLLKSLPGQQLRIYHGTAEVPGHLRWLELIEVGRQVDDGTGESSAGEIQRQLVGQISLSEPLIAEPGDKFVARYEDTGVTGGEIIVGVRARWLSRKELMFIVRLLLKKDYAAAVELYIELSPHFLVKSDAVMAILPFAERLLLSTHLLGGKLVVLGEFLTTAKARELLAQKILNGLDELEKSSATDARKQSDDGVSLESLRAKTLGHIDRSVFQAIVKELVESGKAAKNGDKLSSAKAAREVITAQEVTHEIDARIIDVLQKQFCLEIKEVARLLNASVSEVEASLKRLTKRELATIVAHEYVSSTGSIEKAHDILAQIWQQRKEISPSDFKEGLGVSRKYAMALLTYFDHHNVTRRMANSRVLVKPPRPKQ